MKEFKGTKGEWYKEGNHSFQSNNMVYVKTDETYIANIFSQADGRDNVAKAKEAEANAKLIAAAPELLEALMFARVCSNYQEAKTLYGGDENHWTSVLDKAITKALGQ